jgi:hypothetical protein
MFDEGSLIDVPEDAVRKLGERIAPVHHGHSAELVCYCCRGKDFWLSIHDRWICRTCHPPVQGAEKKVAA